MKIQKEYILAVFGIIAFLCVGVVMLIYFGISDVFYFAVAIVAIGIVVAIYYVWKSTTAKKAILWLRASKEKTAAEIKEIYLKAEKMLDKISKEVPDISIDTEKEVLNSTKIDMISLRCFTAKYELIYSELEKLNLSYLQQKKRDIEEKVNKIYTDLKAKLQKWISEYNGNLNKIIDNAKNVGFEVEKFTFDENIKDVNEAIEKIIHLKNKFSEIYDSLYFQVSNLEEIARDRVDTTSQKEKILSAYDNKNFYGLSMFVVVKNELNNLLANDVSRLKEAVLNINMNNLRDEGILSDDEKKELEHIINAVKTMNVSTIKDIAFIETKYRNFLKNTIQKVYKNAISLKNFISQQELPQELMTYRETDIPTNPEISNAPIDVFAQQCFERIKNIQAIYEKNDVIRRIIKNYPIIKDMIEKIISKKGEISVNDLRINHAKEFLIYYKFKNPDMSDKVKIYSYSHNLP